MAALELGILKGEAEAVVEAAGEGVDVEAVTKEVPKLRLDGEDVEELNREVELVEAENGELVVVAFGVPSKVVLPKRDDPEEPVPKRELPAEVVVLPGTELVAKREELAAAVFAGTLLKSEPDAVEEVVLPNRDVVPVAWLNGAELPKREEEVEGAEELKSPIPEDPEDEDPKRLVPDAR